MRCNRKPRGSPVTYTTVHEPAMQSGRKQCPEERHLALWARPKMHVVPMSLGGMVQLPVDVYILEARHFQPINSCEYRTRPRRTDSRGPVGITYHQPSGQFLARFGRRPAGEWGGKAQGATATMAQKSCASTSA